MLLKGQSNVRKKTSRRQVSASTTAPAVAGIRHREGDAALKGCETGCLASQWRPCMDQLRTRDVYPDSDVVTV